MKWKKIGVVAILALLSIGVLNLGQITKAEDKKVIRLGYAQVREYSSFAQQLLMLAEELERQGSIEEGFSDKYAGVNYDQNFQDGDTLTLWNDICDHQVEGGTYHFVRNAFFDMGTLPEQDYESMVNRSDVDVTFAMGTATGVYFQEHEKNNKFMVMLAADPVASGIVKSETERYSDNAYALIDNTAYERQLQAGYKFLHFKKLGLVFEKSETAYAYSAIDSVKAASEKWGFDMVVRHVQEPTSDSDFPRYYRELKKAYRELVDEGIDTLYITVSSTDYPKELQNLLDDYVMPHNIPTLAQDDVIPVECGALFGVSLVDYSEQAYHVIDQLRQYAEQGVAFDQLEQVCECTPKLFLNYTTAKEIGFEIPFSNLQIIDTIYR